MTTHPTKPLTISEEKKMCGDEYYLPTKYIDWKFVQFLWSSVFMFGREVQTPPQNDGKLCWDLVKPTFQKVPGTGQWGVRFVRDFDLRPYIDSKEEVHHFFVQHFRIPCERECSIVRLMQVAYNAGQLAGSTSRHLIPREILQGYELRDMAKLEAYCTDSDERFGLTADLFSECMDVLTNAVRSPLPPSPRAEPPRPPPTAAAAKAAPPGVYPSCFYDVPDARPTLATLFPNLTPEEAMATYAQATVNEAAAGGPAPWVEESLRPSMTAEEVESEIARVERVVQQEVEEEERADPPRPPRDYPAMVREFYRTDPPPPPPTNPPPRVEDLLAPLPPDPLWTGPPLPGFEDAPTVVGVPPPPAWLQEPPPGTEARRRWDETVV